MNNLFFPNSFELKVLNVMVRFFTIIPIHSKSTLIFKSVFLFRNFVPGIEKYFCSALFNPFTWGLSTFVLSGEGKVKAVSEYELFQGLH